MLHQLTGCVLCSLLSAALAAQALAGNGQPGQRQCFLQAQQLQDCLQTATGRETAVRFFHSDAAAGHLQFELHLLHITWATAGRYQQSCRMCSICSVVCCALFVQVLLHLLQAKALCAVI